MADSDYQTFHYTQIFEVGLFGHTFQAECVCGWASRRYDTAPGASSKAALHLLEQRPSIKSALQEAPTEEF